MFWRRGLLGDNRGGVVEGIFLLSRNRLSLGFEYDLTWRAWWLRRQECCSLSVLGWSKLNILFHYLSWLLIEWNLGLTAQLIDWRALRFLYWYLILRWFLNQNGLNILSWYLLSTLINSFYFNIFWNLWGRILKNPLI